MPRILYIEDEPEIAELVRRWLEEDDEHRLLQAGDAETGLALARSECPDLILLDLGLPDLNGLEVIKRIRHARSKIPIIVLSTRSD